MINTSHLGMGHRIPSKGKDPRVVCCVGGQSETHGRTGGVGRDDVTGQARLECQFASKAEEK